MKSHPLYTVDVFAQEKFTGNQLAVVDNAHDLSSDTLQRIAREMNYSETTFITDTVPSKNGFRVRIFTPESELPFAGHPTLGTAFILREYVMAGRPDRVVLDLDIGSIPVIVERDDKSQEIYWMEQNPPIFSETIDVDRAANIIGLNGKQIDSAYEPQIVSTGVPTLIIPLTSIDAAQKAEIENSPYQELVDEHDAKLVLLFTAETIDPANDLHARVFAPALGVAEDPATGSSNGCLAGYLARNQYFETESLEHTVEQGYEIDRPSLINLRTNVRNKEIQVSIGGRVIPISEGVLL